VAQNRTVVAKNLLLVICSIEKEFKSNDQLCLLLVRPILGAVHTFVWKKAEFQERKIFIYLIGQEKINVLRKYEVST
jgi:hypothetical protein